MNESSQIFDLSENIILYIKSYSLHYNISESDAVEKIILENKLSTYNICNAIELFSIVIKLLESEKYLKEKDQMNEIKN